MDARWMPLLAGALGVLGGVGGAFVGGSVANEGQEKRFERERAAAVQDLRVGEYANFLAAAEVVWGKALTESAPADVNAAFVSMISAKARVWLIAGDEEVGNAADAVANAIAEEDVTDEQHLKDYQTAGDQFLAAAQKDITETAG